MAVSFPAVLADINAARGRLMRRAWLRSGKPCTVHGDVVLGPGQGTYDSVSSVSVGDRFGATITQHLVSAEPLTVPEDLIDDGYTESFEAVWASARPWTPDQRDLRDGQD